jgi:hypothetical protein
VVVVPDAVVVPVVTTAVHPGTAPAVTFPNADPNWATTFTVPPPPLMHPCWTSRVMALVLPTIALDFWSSTIAWAPAGSELMASKDPFTLTTKPTIKVVRASRWRYDMWRTYLARRIATNLHTYNPDGSR